jgi:ankyrin repeat protein
MNGNAEAIDSLLGLGSVAFDVNAEDQAGHTALISAIAAGKEEAALHLLEHGADRTSQATDKGRVALHYAARASMHIVAEKILTHNPLDTINTQDNAGWTPLALSCTSPSPTILPLLLSHGANPEIPNHAGDKPLHIALQRPWHTSPRDTRSGSPALDLIKADVDITSCDKQNRTPLHLASQFHNLPAATLLLSKGACPNVLDDKGRAPLSVCSNS